MKRKKTRLAGISLRALLPEDDENTTRWRFCFYCDQILRVVLLPVLTAHPVYVLAEELAFTDLPAHASVQPAVTPEQALLKRGNIIKQSRIVMHTQESGEKLADQLQTMLTILGATKVETRIVEDVPEGIEIRYFHPADQAAGQVVKEALTLVFDEVAVRSFEDYEPAPSDSLIEIWMR